VSRNRFSKYVLKENMTVLCSSCRSRISDLKNCTCLKGCAQLQHTCWDHEVVNYVSFSLFRFQKNNVHLIHISTVLCFRCEQKKRVFDEIIVEQEEDTKSIFSIQAKTMCATSRKKQSVMSSYFHLCLLCFLVCVHHGHQVQSELWTPV